MLIRMEYGIWTRGNNLNTQTPLNRTRGDEESMTGIESLNGTRCRRDVYYAAFGGSDGPEPRPIYPATIRQYNQRYSRSQYKHQARK